MRPEKVVIYDPNWINPYGLELSSVIAACGNKVELWCTKNRIEVPPGVLGRPRLPLGLRTRRGLIPLAIRRFIAPVAIVLSAPLSTPIVVVWTKDPWDAVVFAARSLIGGKTICVYHNPSSIRKRGGLSGKAERALLRVANICIVHSGRLADAAAGVSGNIRIAAHPPYRETTRGVQKGRAAAPGPAARPVVAYVGALRADKGANDILPIAKGAGRGWVLRILGPDTLPAETIKQLLESGVDCEHVGSGSGPSDEELISGLAASTVMIAPYSSVTESGSLHLALSMNVPVLGYESDGLRHIVNTHSMAPDAGMFGKLLSRYLHKPWPTYTEEAADLHSRCKANWIEILNEIC